MPAASKTSHYFTNYQEPQTESVYQWEDDLFPDCHTSYLTLNECRDIVASVWSSFNIQAPVPTVLDGRGSRTARALDDKIHLPRWSRNETVVLHELSHCITDLFCHDESYDHGPLYVRIYLTVLAHYKGLNYKFLHRNATSAGIKIKRINVQKWLAKIRMN